jgi:uncharacterized damage-inducible protein DinB
VDRAAIEEIFEYDDYAWRRIGKAVATAGDEVITRAAPGSGWPALRDCLTHIGWGYEIWLNRLNGREPDRTEPPELDNWAKLDGYREQGRTAVRELLGGLSDDELQREREYPLDGGYYSYSPAQLLTHLALHERGHHGDVNTLFYQLGLEPAVPDYRGVIIERRGYAVDY